MTRIEIADPADDRIALFLGLRDHVARQRRERPGGDRAGSFIAEGDLVIERALAAGCSLESVLVDAGRPRPLPNGIDGRIPVFEAHPEVLRVITGRAELRDPLAAFTRPELPTADELIEASTVVAVLEGVNNPNNLGVIMRNAAGLGVDAVLLDPTCGDPLYRRAIRASMGQVFAVPHARIDALPNGLDLLHDRGFRSLALVPSAESTLGEASAAEKVAILLGAEGSGLQPSTIEAATGAVRIAMAAGVDSLNVASAAAIAFHHVAMMRKTPSSRLKA